MASSFQIILYDLYISETSTSFYGSSLTAGKIPLLWTSLCEREKIY